MKRARIIGSLGWTLGLALIALVAVTLHASDSADSDLCAELESMRLFLGAWVGAREEEPARPWSYRSWTPILGGYAIRDARSVPEFDFEAGTTVFFDRAAGEVAYVDFTDNGYITRGTIVLEDGVFVQAGAQIQPDSTTRSVRSAFSFEDENTMHERYWSLEDGEWQPGHSIIYSRQE